MARLEELADLNKAQEAEAIIEDPLKI